MSVYLKLFVKKSSQKQDRTGLKLETLIGIRAFTEALGEKPVQDSVKTAFFLFLVFFKN